MVTIIDYKERTNDKGEKFFALMLQGDVDIILSSKGNYYATAKKTSITSTFNENTCKALVGKQLAGTIEKVPCEEYEFIVEETGEVIKLEFRYSYVPANQTQVETQNPKPSPMMPIGFDSRIASSLMA